MSDVDTLIELGFSKERVLVALQATENQGIEAAADWLLAHGMEVDEAEIIETGKSAPPPEVTAELQTETALGGGANLPDLLPNPDPSAVGEPKKDEQDVADDDDDDEEETPQAACMRCDVCGRCFADASGVQKHAARTSHDEFSEITADQAENIEPPKQQLTEEERQLRLKRAEELIKQRRAEKSEKEKQEKLEKEKIRRKTGQELLSMKQRFKEEEMKRDAEERRREKAEAKLERQRILEQIERDKADRREKFSMKGPQPAPVAAAVPVSVVSQPKTEYTECRLQIRLTNGETLKETFQPNEQLAAVRLYVQLNRTDGDGAFCLLSAFPRQVYTEDDMEKSLSSLGLVPSAVLMVKRQ